MQETWVPSLGQEDPLEKGNGNPLQYSRLTHSNILAWKIPWTEEPGSLQSMGLQRFRHSWAAKQQTSNEVPQQFILEGRSPANSTGWQVLRAADFSAMCPPNKTRISALNGREGSSWVFYLSPRSSGWSLYLLFLYSLGFSCIQSLIIWIYH